MAFRLPGFLSRRDRSGVTAAAQDSKQASSPTYAPVANGRPDPGEVVWAWVPYEEDTSQGKDRPSWCSPSPAVG